MGIKFEKTVPILRDSDPDYETHWRQFQSILDCYSFGRTAVRPIDTLNYYLQAHPAGSARLLIYDTLFKQAMIAGRLPHEAKDVFEEIKARMKSAIEETWFQNQDRLDREFEALAMGNKSHAEFRAQFEAKLCEMAQA